MRAVNACGKGQQACKGEDYRVRQQRIYDFMADKTFSEFTGPLSEEADAFFRPTVSRSSGDPEEISAGAGVGYFLLVWDKSSGLARNIVGGAATLPQAIAHTLGDKVKLGAEVLEVIQHRDHVEVTYKSDGKEVTEQARYAVITTPAAITHRITKNLDPLVHDALGKIQYGHYVSGAFLTNETGRRPWDSVYAYCTPQRSFNIAFNMSNLVRTMESERQPGSSFMVFSPAKLAHATSSICRMKRFSKSHRKDLGKSVPRLWLSRRGAERPKIPSGARLLLPRAQQAPAAPDAHAAAHLPRRRLPRLVVHEAAIRQGSRREDINSKLYTDTHRPPTASPC